MAVEQVIKLVLVDENQIFLEGLSYIIGMNKQLKVVGIANSGKEALKKIDETIPDVAIISFVLPDFNGIRLAREIFQKRKDIQIIILSVYNDPEFLKAARKTGVFAYLYKNESIDDLNQTILKAYQALKKDMVPKV